MTRSCPECGSNDMRNMNVGQGQTHWRCNKCGYMGSVEVDFPDESLKKMKALKTAEKLEKKMRKMEGLRRR